MTFSQSASPYFKSLASNQRLYLLINTDCEIEESNLNNWADASITGKNVGILWGNTSSPLSIKIVETINAVFNSGEPHILPLQQGSIPIYNIKCSYWQISFYPIFYNEQVQSILLQLEDVSHLINLKIDSTQRNSPKPHSNLIQIKELKKENVQLKLEEERFRLLVDNIKDYAIFLLDKKGFITTWNRGAEAIKQYTSNEIIGQHFSIFYTEEAKQRNHPQQELNLAIKNGRYEEEGWRVKKDGSLFWANVIITPIFNDAGILIGFGKVTRDLNERKKIEDLKNEFISVVSHELRTPLTSIRGALSLLLESEIAQFSEKNTHLLHIAHINSERLTRLINDVLDIEKLQDGHMKFNFERLNIKLLIEEAIHLNTLFAAKYNVHIVGYSLIDTYVYADADRLIQVITNLLSNAIKFSPKGNNVEITMGRNKKYVSVYITDRGPGIPADFKNKIFQRFFQVDSSIARKRDGTGLGLTISKSIIEHHKGILNYRSFVNKVTSFYFRLPLEKD